VNEVRELTTTWSRGGEMSLVDMRDCIYAWVSVGIEILKLMARYVCDVNFEQFFKHSGELPICYGTLIIEPAKK